ncbi:hypothetical protein SAMN05216267_1005229 [Actinacidiphila rubida]|uniref:Lipoprotein n=1 Tax=Actinacidiphila rubida TaxID=310780 RepID=A0A1H8GSI8_9ACTN|nr:hypothetical protein [Actinacidiphila rubida]SEN46248.1 hypothetical protein SAMN05216267_1005229 [Actinacidiphila rubida]
MTRTPTRPSAALRAGVSVAALAASGALLLTACSSSSGSSADAKPSGSASGSPASSKNGAASMEAYRQCLQQHGVNLPSFQGRSPGQGRPSGAPSGRPSGGFGGRGGGGFPGFGGASADPATQKALDACKSLRPQFNGRGGAGGGSSAFQAFASCLKDHGVTLPTASPGATNRPGGGFGALRGINTADPKTAKAYDTCKALLPQRPSGGPSGNPSPSATA